jgi:hypothetical protein
MRFVEGRRRRGSRRLQRDWDGSRIGLRSFHVWRFDELWWLDGLWRNRHRRRRSVRRYEPWRLLERWSFR